MPDKNGLSFTEEEVKEFRLVDGRTGIAGAVSDGGVGRIGGVDRNIRRTESDGNLQKQRTDRLAVIAAAGEKRMTLPEIEILIRSLPVGFIQAYLSVVDMAVGEKNLGSGRGYDENDLGLGKRSGVQVKSERKDHRGGAEKGKKSGESPVPIKSESALIMRRKADRSLREISRRLMSFLNSNSGMVTQRRCSGRCKRFGDAEYLFCPWCGGPMQDVV